jgi:hypothetical protein
VRGVEFATTIADDGINGYLYCHTDASGKYQTYVGSGEPIAVWPGRAQRLYILQDIASALAPIDRRLFVQMHYRPRRLTI